MAQRNTATYRFEADDERVVAARARRGDRWFGVLVHPREAAFASLRAHAIDALGQRNAIDHPRVSPRRVIGASPSPGRRLVVCRRRGSAR